MRKLTAVTIKNLRLKTIIGILPEERRTPQKLVITATIYYDDHRAAQSENIEDTVDYSTLEEKIYRKVSESQFFLLEALSEYILDIIMEESIIKKAVVSIEKPEALTYSDTVIITKERDNQ